MGCTEAELGDSLVTAHSPLTLTGGPHRAKARDWRSVSKQYGVTRDLTGARREGLRHGGSREGGLPRCVGGEQLSVLDQCVRLIDGETRHQAIAPPVERRQLAAGERPVDDPDLIVRTGATDELDPTVVLV